MSHIGWDFLYSIIFYKNNCGPQLRFIWSFFLKIYNSKKLTACEKYINFWWEISESIKNLITHISVFLWRSLKVVAVFPYKKGRLLYNCRFRAIYIYSASWLSKSYSTDKSMCRVKCFNCFDKQQSLESNKF